MELGKKRAANRVRRVPVQRENFLVDIEDVIWKTTDQVQHFCVILEEPVAARQREHGAMNALVSTGTHLEAITGEEATAPPRARQVVLPPLHDESTLIQCLLHELAEDSSSSERAIGIDGLFNAVGEEGLQLIRKQAGPPTGGWWWRGVDFRIFVSSGRRLTVGRTVLSHALLQCAPRYMGHILHCAVREPLLEDEAHAIGSRLLASHLFLGTVNKHTMLLIRLANRFGGKKRHPW